MRALENFIEGVEREILGPILTLIALAAFLVFIWGVIDFIRSAGDSEKRTTGQQHMLWGIVGLAIIFSANALISIIAATVR
jgi:Type IV secretion system pilin